MFGQSEEGNSACNTESYELTELDTLGKFKIIPAYAKILIDAGISGCDSSVRKKAKLFTYGLVTPVSYDNAMSAELYIINSTGGFETRIPCIAPTENRAEIIV